MSFELPWIFGRPVRGLAFFALSLINVKKRTSTPILIEQRVRSEAEKAAAKKRSVERKKKKKKSDKRGRPPGSKNKNKQKKVLSPELVWIQKLIQKVLKQMQSTLSLTYLVLDGHFGHKAAVQMVSTCGLQIISKLRSNAALIFQYEGVYSGKGRPKIYGDKVDYQQLPEKHLLIIKNKDEVQTKIYQFQARHKKFPELLTVVVIIKVNFVTQKRGHIVLFSTDLNLDGAKIVDYYSLRFQIEFNFRDAKQHWGLEDFMATSERAVANSAALSLFMVSVSQALLPRFRSDDSVFNVLALKAHFRGHKYVVETLKLLPKYPEPFLMTRIFKKISQLGSINCEP